ncbi:DNA gyrase subunit A [Candidatus Desulforudis audaxviator]|uniref:DNA gyrase subunit A n=1 Tax=Desulforudis audaxviator (strain MP104C) TaxID=477974 RepID=B1I1I1_DESAP|nr:DNA gyrase subunit A [Candidatus Desulforudis audaxviator]ACA58577.1 DNA gyrase, A subunit [Candidatus Desulforudis audaxviator MP104C]AZK58568.1 DNA gyrase subunit A [Candidatus Desulforudis audaxviator]
MAAGPGKIVPIDINEELKHSYLDYAMSVIVGRALPDVRDGLKPVHRRILYAMHNLGLTADKPHRKSAYVVGEVLSKLHPHGDAAVYDALVRLAQDFACRYPLVDGHGNFGSIDGDAAAAMRYTEVRMARITSQMLADIDKETVDFIPNYDGTGEEPVVLPSRIPNLLVNGSAGIAVGMATNIPPHNLKEVIDGLVYLADHPDAELEDLMRFIPGPDFPTGGKIMGRHGIVEAYRTGRGSIKMRGHAEFERVGSRTRIVITELPYQVNKARLVEKIAALVREKKIEGISDLRDESDRKGMRVVIELRREVNPEITLNLLYKHTQLQDNFGVILLALVDGQPQVLALKDILSHYLGHQREVITRRCRYELSQAQARLHIVEGLRIALAHLDEVIQTIRRSRDVAEARLGLMAGFGLSEKQAQAILDMRLQRLTALERDKLENEFNDLVAAIERLEALLADEQKILAVVKEELLAVRDKFADPRRTELVAEDADFNPEDLIPQEDAVIILTNDGYIKRMPPSVYRSQRRGGRGIAGVETKVQDFVRHLFVGKTHDYLLFFTERGKVYRVKVYEIPEAGRQARGTAVVNLIPVANGERVTAVIPVTEYSGDAFLFMVTRKGIVKKTVLQEFDSARRDGLIALTLDEGDELVDVKITDGKSEVLLGTRNGMVIRFPEGQVRPMGRTAHGVRGISLREGDMVVGMDIVDPDDQLLVVSEKGYGKVTPVKEFRVQSRGGFGLIAARVSGRNGPLVSLSLVGRGEEILIVSKSGILIRMKIDEIPQFGRQAQGVRLMRLAPGDAVVAVAWILPEDPPQGE